MKHTTVFATLIASALSVIVIDSPWTGGPGDKGTWTAGQTATITWHTEGSNNPTTVNFDIVSGPNSDLKSIASIGQNVQVSAGKLTITVPSNLPASNAYAIRASSGSTTVFSSVFNFVNDNPTKSASSASSATPTNMKNSTAPTNNVTVNNDGSSVNSNFVVSSALFGFSLFF